jgi:hypothetical protein
VSQLKEPIDWIRAVFFGAISGGFLWAIMVRMLSIVTHEHMHTHALYLFCSSVSLAILAIGIILYLRAKTSLWRSTAIGIILAPLTGWSVLLFVTVTVVLPSQGTQ